MKNQENALVISYLTLRKLVGILGILLPILMVVGSFLFNNCTVVQESISNYYHTNMGDSFVGILCAVSLFLFSYKGYSSLDNIASSLAGIFGLGVAFFPTNPIIPTPNCNIPTLQNNPLISSIHFVSAGIFLAILAYFSLVLFTKGAQNPSKQKRKRNIVYKTCGYIIIVCLLLLVIHLKIIPLPKNLFPVFTLETIALWAFGISWLIKGEFLLKDEVKP